MAEQPPGAMGREAEAQLLHEIIFQRLPPLDSREFIQFIQTATVSDLPPEVLVRAFRQLPPASHTSRIVLERLFQKRGECWDYLGPVVAFARWSGQTICAAIANRCVCLLRLNPPPCCIELVLTR